MELHDVTRLLARRVSEEDGSVEYKVQWCNRADDEEFLPPSWEPRASLLEGCASAVADMDRRAEAATERRLAAWYRTQQDSQQSREEGECEVPCKVHVGTHNASSSPSIVQRDDDDEHAGPSSRPVMHTLLWSDDAQPTSPHDRRVGRPSTTTATSYNYSSTHAAASGNESSSTSSEAKLKRPAAVSSVLLRLGELTPSPDVATALAGTTSKRPRTTHSHHHNQQQQQQHALAGSEAEARCAAAHQLERRWKEEMGTSLLHSCLVARRVSALPAEFAMGEATPKAEARTRGSEGEEVDSHEAPSIEEKGDDEEDDEDDARPMTLQAMRAEEQRRAAGLEIVGIAPIDTSRAGLVYRDPFSLGAMIGEEAAERLKRESAMEHGNTTSTASAMGSGGGGGGGNVSAAAAQELLRERREQMMVRYLVDAAEEEVRSGSSQCDSDAEGKEGEEGGCDDAQHREEDNNTQVVSHRRVLGAMPLSVFRFAFPQLLLDYLLTHSVVLEGGGGSAT